MKEIISECNRLLNELYRFSEDVIDFGKPIDDNRLEFFEKTINHILPLDMKCILKRHNGISLMGTEILGIDSSLRESSLDKVYEFEHHIAKGNMPKELLPFSPDGRGNHYCLNLAKTTGGLCPVVFWQWDYDYANMDDVEECNDSLLSWISEVMIEWTVEDYDYDGNQK